MDDEDKVIDYLNEKDLVCTRFSKTEKRHGKTPDFRVFKDDQFKFYCEVKSIIKDQWLDKQFEASPEKVIVGGVRNDPIFNRITSDIRSAVKQFDAVNPKMEYPNVLSLVNHDDMCGFLDLVGVITGNFIAEDGKDYPIYHHFSDGRIKNQKERIHLFIWIDEFKPNRLFFNQSSEMHYLDLCNLFGMNSNSIITIGS